MASVVLLTAAFAFRHRGGEIFALPHLWVWASLVGAFFVGRFLGQVPSALGPGWRVAAVTAVAVLLPGTWLAFGYLVLGAPGSQAARATVLIGAALLIGALLRVPTGHSRWVLLLAVQVLAGWLLVDIVYVRDGPGLYDYRVYLAGGATWVAGGEPYLAEVLQALPARAAEDPFLYPPPLLPFFGVLSLLPAAVAHWVWVALLLGSGAIAFRLLGASWRWSLLLLAFPPMAKGVDSGNVTHLLLLILAAAPFAGGGLVLSGLFKPHAGIPALWLVAERRWAQLALGIGGLLLIAVMTLPLTGLERWIEWVISLGYREQTQQALPILYGHSLAQYLPLWAFIGLAAVAILLPLVVWAGRRSLAGLGIATIVASPSLWPHGFAMALPAALRLPAPILWLVLGLSAGGSWWIWLLPIAGGVALLLDWNRPLPTDPLHPLAGRRGPWPNEP